MPTKTGPGLMTRATATYISETPADEVARDLTILPRHTQWREINAHVRLPYKKTPAYWYSPDGANPPELDMVLQKLVQNTDNNHETQPRRLSI